ncbi:506c9d23-ddf9-4595-bd6c-2853da167824 [Thermothielavioides terrestris]|uniref:Uncharacterized protein n=2 Tax=Thermothielavioides terrestris TaxID=2587410 RepID=G2R7R7_THETT|nr:uncharacterized protein THITE_2117212 [Thermothielavioides terrestris NRRL 8126]AEO67976.1 hypothetical protein THITE_2117212 [Thermothielavioides terrestris NRRL 8126]SPQ24787.1 506c9d23-ddf9-4595-bd6c-2853da167824 [Thermothielavioides terrestris]
MWPAAPKNSKISQIVGPTSPPQTPRTASPVFGRKSSPRLGELPSKVPLHPMAAPPLETGHTAVNGPGFGHATPIRPQQLSPRPTSSSSSASSVASSDSEDSALPSNAAGPSAPASASATPERRPGPAPHAPQARMGRIVTQADFVVEELSDFGDSDDAERPGVIRPCAIEYAESDRSRSRSRNRPEIDHRMMFNFVNLNCSDDSDELDLDEHEYQEFLLKRRAERRRKRMSSGSIGKRTISESIGSDTDREDIRSFLGADEAGSSARRLRRRVGDRRSLQFQDPPPPRIDELDEPASSEDEIFIGESLARELPFFEYVMMEVDSP